MNCIDPNWNLPSTSAIHKAQLTAEIFGLSHKSQVVDNSINVNFYIRHVSRTICIMQVTVNVQIVMIAWNWKYNYSLANPACQKEGDPLRSWLYLDENWDCCQNFGAIYFCPLLPGSLLSPFYSERLAPLNLTAYKWEKQDCEFSLSFDIDITIQQLET